MGKLFEIIFSNEAFEFLKGMDKNIMKNTL